MRPDVEQNSRVLSVRLPESVALQVEKDAVEQRSNVDAIFLQAFRAYQIARLNSVLENARVGTNPEGYTEDQVGGFVKEARQELHSRR